ncbi:MAG: response regulator [Bdellovibrionales bacterium]|nr:response regulator [Bdellovibrionales bacterium]
MSKNIGISKETLRAQDRTFEKFRRMATVIQDSNDAITFQDLEGKILAWNRGAEIMYGYTEIEALGMNIVDTVPKEYQEEARGFLASLKRGELVPTLETKRKTKTGQIVDVWLTNTKVTDDKGVLTGIATTERDISERKRTEATLREKFRELDYLRAGQIALSESLRGEQMIAGLGQSILTHLVPFTNAQVGAFYIVNEAKELHRVSGYALSKSEQINPKALKIIQFGEGLIGQVAIDKRTLRIDDVPPEYFSKIQSDLGELVPRSLLICPILYENEINGVIELGSLQPFTEHHRIFLSHVSENIGIAINTSIVRKKIQKQNEEFNKTQILLEEKAKEVQRASQYKTEFLANMSHELRTPLNSSLILAKLLMDNVKGHLSIEETQFASSIYSSSKDLLNLINDILDLSKVEAGKLEIRVEKILLSEIMAGLSQTFEALANEKKLTFSITKDFGVPEIFHTDRQRLEQILKNIISNGIKFTDNGSVKVRLYRPLNSRHLAFEVSDTGIGIREEQLAFVFEAFRQADGAITRKYGGTGLGLSISRDLTQLLGGTIEVKSQLGIGSQFTLILPEMLVASSNKGSRGPTFSVENSKYYARQSQNRISLPFEDDRLLLTDPRPMILVIEDDLKFAKIVLDVSHEAGLRCIVGQGSDEGYEMALHYSPHGILLDVKLPDHLGLTTLSRLKANSKTRHIPVFSMSVVDYRIQTLRLGSIGFLEKPAKMQNIRHSLELLKTHLERTTRRVLVFAQGLNEKTILQLLTDQNVVITNLMGAIPSGIPTFSNLSTQLSTEQFDFLVFGLSAESPLALDFLENVSEEQNSKWPPILIYIERPLTRERDLRLRVAEKRFIIKVATSPERFFDEVALVLHLDEAKMSSVQKQMVTTTRLREQIFEGRKILIVDDDVRNIFALTSALEQKGATILVARNGQECLDKLDQDPLIDLVLMDIMMPEMNGYEATQRIRRQSRFATLPIIAVTAQAMVDDQEKCITAGVNDYISKPVDLEKLQSMIRVWIVG